MKHLLNENQMYLDENDKFKYSYVLLLLFNISLTRFFSLITACDAPFTSILVPSVYLLVGHSLGAIHKERPAKNRISRPPFPLRLDKTIESHSNNS